MSLVKRFEATIQGAMVLTGNTLQVRLGTSYPPAANDFVNGSYISTNTALVAGGGFPPGTTFTASQASSSAVLSMPTGSTVVFAQLFWNFSGGATPNQSVTLVTPIGTNTISPNTSLNQASGANWRAQDVTSIINSAGPGTYTFSPSPGDNIVNGSSIQGASWQLLVVYRNANLPYRYFNVNTGITPVSTGSPSDFTFTNLVTPSSGTVKGYLLVSEVFGDMLDGARISVGKNLASAVQVGNSSTGSWNNIPPYAQINNMLPGNILIADTNDSSIGLLDTRGTFGTYNKDPFAVTAPPFARNITDILGIDISSTLTINQTSLFTRVFYSGSGSGSVTSQSIQVDVNAATISMNKTVDKDISKVGDTLSYTIVISNSGLADANNVFFIDTVPAGTSFIAGTFAVNGITLPSANPAAPGVNLATIPTNSTITVTFKTLVGASIPSPNPIQNTSQTTFNFVPGTGITPVFSDATSNIAKTTIVSAVLRSSKNATTEVGIFDTITYTIPLANVGNTTATNVVFIDTIPSNTSLISGTLNQDGTSISGSPNPPGINLPNDIASGAVSYVSFKVTVLTIPSPNTISNTVSATYDYTADPSIPITGSGATNSSAANTIVNYATLSSVKSVNKQYADVGDTLIYTVVLKNTGNVTATNIVFIDTIPSSTIFQSNTLLQDSTPVSGTPNPPGITLPNSIAPNGISTVTFRVTVNTIPVPNPIINDSSTSFEYVGDPCIPTIKIDSTNSNNANTIINNANIGNSSKNVDKTFATCGDILTYTILIPNIGNTTAQNVIFKDTIPVGTTFVSNSVYVNNVQQVGANPSGGITIPNISAGTTTTITFQVQIQC